ncbi:MAG: M50 family metallopeptidase [Dehalococcoidia bacterium]
MGSLLTSVVPFVLILVSLVVIHELGHFITAKLAGIKVLEFGIGYPPKLWGKRIGETEYTINALPMGGFVRMLGETDAREADTGGDGKRVGIGVMNTAAQVKTDEIDPRAFAAKPAHIRIIVLAAGVVMNALLPILLFSANFMIPQTVDIGQAQISHVSPNTPAAAAGLQANDIIRKVDGRKIQNVSDVRHNIDLHQGTTMTWQIKRGRTLMDVQVYARWAVPTEIETDGTKVRQGPTGIKVAALNNFTEKQSHPIWDSLILVKNQVISWFASKTAPAVAGPVGIAQVTGQAVKSAGWLVLIQLAAFLSINLAVVNVLPLPMLDGGRILFVLIELARRGKRIAPEKEALVHLLGFALLLSFVVIISYFDIARIVHGESLIK